VDGVVEAEPAIPSGVFILLLCPRYYGVGSDVMVEQRGCVVQEYAQTFVCVCNRWKMVYPMLGLWMEASNSDFILDTVVVGVISSGFRSRVRGHIALV
jgi:hypothetical protein